MLKYLNARYWPLHIIALGAVYFLAIKLMGG